MFLRRLLLMLGLAGCAPVPPAPPAVNSEWSAPEPVTINGYTGPVEDLFITPDGSILFFDSHTDTSSIPSKIYWAKTIDYKTFTFVGEVRGVTARGVTPSMDLMGNFYWLGAEMLADPVTIYRGMFADGVVSAMAPAGLPLTGVPMGISISPDGNTPWYADLQPGTPPPSIIRARGVDDFDLAAVNAVGPTVYNAFSRDGLELFFTSIDASKTSPQGLIYVAKRASLADPFGAPQLIAATGPGLNEGGSISADGKHLYFHKVLSFSDARPYALTRP